IKISLICYFFDLIAKKSEIYKIPKWTQFWHEMFKIAIDAPYDAPPDPLVAKGFLLSAIAALRLRHSQFELLARSYKHPQLLDLKFSPCRLPLFNSVKQTNYGYFCILCPHPIYVFGPSVISRILLLINTSFIYYFFDLIAKKI